jgi:hypothetical protein
LKAMAPRQAAGVPLNLKIREIECVFGPELLSHKQNSQKMS